MRTLPSPATIISNPSVERAFHAFSFQARDRAKAAIKKYTFFDTVDWIVLIGAYWIHLPFGPFTEAQLTARALKPSPSADWLETFAEERRRSGPVPPLPGLFFLCEEDSRKRLEAILASTDGEAQRLIDALGPA